MKAWTLLFLLASPLLGQPQQCSPYTLCAGGGSGGSGTVTSVDLAVPAEWTVSGNPITTAGTITIAEATQTANTCYAGPTSGGAAAPGFRALVDADVPNAITVDLAATATALAANGANCSAGSFALGVDASGAAEGCTVAALGDVVGPASAVDNEVARYDLTTGKLLQGSGVLFADDGTLSVPTPFTVKDKAGTPNQLMRVLESGTWDGQPTTYLQMGEGSNRPTLTGTGGAIVAWNLQSAKFLIGPSQSPPAVSGLAVAQVSNLDGTASSVVLRSKGAASQTGNLFEAQNSAGTNLFRIGPDGYQTWPGEAYLAADGTNATATLATTGLSVNVTTGLKYTFKLILYLADSVAAEGAKIDFDGGSATATNFRVHCAAFDAALALSAQSSALATDFAVATFTGDGMIECHGSFEPSSTGTFIPQYAQNSHATGTLTLYRGSHLTMFEAP